MIYQSELPKPGMVPKDLYGSCEHTDEDWGFDALYQRATVAKGSPHEVCYYSYCCSWTKVFNRLQLKSVKQTATLHGSLMSLLEKCHFLYCVLKHLIVQHQLLK